MSAPLSALLHCLQGTPFRVVLALLVAFGSTAEAADAPGSDVYRLGRGAFRNRLVLPPSGTSTVPTNAPGAAFFGGSGSLTTSSPSTTGTRLMMVRSAFGVAIADPERPDVYLGDEIRPPEIDGTAWVLEDVSDPSKVARIKGTGDPSASSTTERVHAIRGGEVTLRWRKRGAADVLLRHILIYPAPARSPVLLYQTHDTPFSDKGTPLPPPRYGDVPQVSLKQGWSLTVHPPPTNASMLLVATREGAAGSVIFSATNRGGPYLFEYRSTRNGTDDTLEGVEIVETRGPYEGEDVEVDVGDRVQPREKTFDGIGASIVKGADSHLYRHGTTGSRQEGFVFAVRENTDPEQAKLYFLRPGIAGVVWPFAFHRVTAKWPADERKYQRFVRGGLEDQTNEQASVHVKNARVAFESAGGKAFLSAEVFSTRLTAAEHWTLLKLENRGDTGLDVDFQVVRSIRAVPETVKPWAIGTEIRDDGHQPSALAREPLRPGFVYGKAGDAFDPVIYDYSRADQQRTRTLTQQIFPVNKGVLEVWWCNTNKGIQWPSRVVRYDCDWPTNAQRIEIFGEVGSGPLKLNQPEVYYQNDPSKSGYNPNEEHALLAPASRRPPRLRLGSTHIMMRPGEFRNIPVGFVNLATLSDDIVVTHQLITEAGIVDAGTGTNHISIRYPADGTSLLFPSTNWQKSQSLGISTTNLAPSGQDRFYVVYAMASGGFQGSARIQIDVPGTNVVTPVIEDVALDVLEGGTQTTRVRLNRQPFAEVRLQILASSSADLLEVSPREMTFHTNSWDVPQSISIEAKRDPADVSDQVRQFALVMPTPTIPVTNEVIVTHVDNDSVGLGVFALRDDLNSQDTSRPFVLLRSNVSPPDSPSASAGKKYSVFEVIRGEPKKALEVGQLFEPPYPLTLLNLCPDRSQVLPDENGTRYHWVDRNGNNWAIRAAFKQGEPDRAQVRTRWFYPVPGGRGFARAGRVGTAFEEGECLPWLTEARTDSHRGREPIDFVYSISWPSAPPRLAIGETLVKQRFGLPNIANQCSVDILFDEPHDAYDKPRNVLLLQPLSTVSVHSEMSSLPPSVRTEQVGGKLVILNDSIPLTLRQRFRFDPNSKRLELGGIYDGTSSILIPNRLSGRERDLLLSLSTDAKYTNEINKLYSESHAQSRSGTNASTGFKALSAGAARQPGFVTLAFQNHTNCGSLPVTVASFRVDCPKYQGAVHVLLPECVFDEKVTLMHSGDFGGASDDFEFQWSRYMGRGTPNIADNPDTDKPAWVLDTIAPGSVPDSSTNGPILDISGAGLKTLMDQWYVCRYRRADGAQDSCGGDGWSAWTEPKLVSGWLSRVLRGLNAFDDRFTNYDSAKPDLRANMIEQAGTRWEGDIALNCRPENEFGLIEGYETVFRRGMRLSLDAGFRNANSQLLRVAGRISDLYMLLADEAYADASDPTVPMQSGASIAGLIPTVNHCFKGFDQTPTLLDEELALLRGLSDRGTALSVRQVGVHNRLRWNVGSGVDGEVAYVQNYGVDSKEAAGRRYPQGHGDAWGHLLTALKPYYRLLRHPEFDWSGETNVIDVPGIGMLGARFFHAKRFAAVGAALARTGAEIVDLTYRDKYALGGTEQWFGYPDSDSSPKSTESLAEPAAKARELRAWGVADWTARVGQGAFLNWVVANSLLPPETNSRGQEYRIDRANVTEVQEMAASFRELQDRMDAADGGLNPMGFQDGVFPLAIDRERYPELGIYRQYAERAQSAIDATDSVFRKAAAFTSAIRNEQAFLDDYRESEVQKQENEYRNRLIEIFGQPYPEDPAYTESKEREPDLLHYAYVDIERSATQVASSGLDVTAVVHQREYGLDASRSDGAVTNNTKTVSYNFSSDGFVLVKPESWSRRPAYGQIQITMASLARSVRALESTIDAYDDLVARIEEESRLLQAKFGTNANEILILDQAAAIQASLNSQIATYQAYSSYLQIGGQRMLQMANAAASGMTLDFAKWGSTATLVAASIAWGFEAEKALLFDNLQLQKSFEKEYERDVTNRRLQASAKGLAFQEELVRLEQLIRQEPLRRAEIQQQVDAVRLGQMEVQSSLARGRRLVDERTAFRQRTASKIREHRYRDMAFRTFRAEALQRYRAQFDVAARNVYLAALAFDYETCLLRTDGRGGQRFLESIVRERNLGDKGSAVGLAAQLAELNKEFGEMSVRIRPSGNPNLRTSFSLRRELFGVGLRLTDDEKWRWILREYRVDDILRDEDFRQQVGGSGGPVPALRIPFGTLIQSPFSFFVRAAPFPTGPQEGRISYFHDGSHAVRLNSLQVRLENYPSSQLVMSPYVYLLPVGLDRFRAPDGVGYTRSFAVRQSHIGKMSFDDSDFETVEWSPILKFFGRGEGLFRVVPTAHFPADHAGYKEGEKPAPWLDLAGRSAWNTGWKLIILERDLQRNRTDPALDWFIGDSTPGSDGVTDIALVFDVNTSQRIEPLP